MLRAAPSVGADKPRSSFESKLIASTAPGVAETKGSNVCIIGSASTIFDANHGAELFHEKPSIDDAMSTHERDCDDDDDHSYQDYQRHQSDPRTIDETQSRPSYADEQRHSRPSTGSSQRSPLSVQVEEVHDGYHQPPSPVQSQEDGDDHSPLPIISGLEAQIRPSELILSCQTSMGSAPHLAINSKDEEKRDSGKPPKSDLSNISQPTLLRTTPSGFNLSPKPLDVNSLRDSWSPISPILGRPAFVTSPAGNNFPELCPRPSPTETKKPCCQDRYGFKRESQHISGRQYNKWNSSYSKYLMRRRQRWEVFFKENSLITDEPNRFPAPSSKTKRFIRKGIPPEWRGSAWFYYAGGPAILAKYPGLYAKMLSEKAKRVNVEAIERDLHRTFPDNVYFNPHGMNSASDSVQETIAANNTVQAKPGEPSIISSLRRVLFAFSIYNPNIDYCRPLNCIAGLLLLFVDTEEQCFWLLNIITHIYLPNTYELSSEGSEINLSILMAEIRDTMPAVWDKIGGELESQPNSRPITSRAIHWLRLGRTRGKCLLPTKLLPPVTLCVAAWFKSCFIGTLPIETVLRVWDVIFYEGSKALFRVALPRRSSASLSLSSRQANPRF